MKIALILNSSWNIVNFRSGLVNAIQARGHQVLALSPHDAHTDRLKTLGCDHANLPMQTTGLNPIADITLLVRLLLILRKEQPDVILSYTIKPNIYGSLAARVLGIPVINNVAGLGMAFTREGWLKTLVSRLFRFAFAKSHTIFFQNEDDRRMFVDKRLASEHQTVRLPGSGVDLDKFRPPHRRPHSGGMTFILVARLLREKGVADFVAAARLLRSDFPNASWRIVGFLEPNHPAFVSESEMHTWVTEGTVTFDGPRDDVRQALCEADCMVLPSYYREGVPRSLLEAAAMGLPLITCDTVGCRDAVTAGTSGLLCAPRDPTDLARCMRQILEMSEEARAAMGREGRLKMEREFGESRIVEAYMDAITRASAMSSSI
ncbi:glycosyltransferase family 4 protein [Aquabacterium soli]|uniref:glycosyltransferase family 4 protein n=1 Tax=Aquabacterium soli TaxID=2493092 RepID=UPI001315743D|nr:glycosyltransferase family 4 protein [Aquabacterium soli]